MTQDAEFYFRRSKERYKAGDVAGGNADLDQAIVLAPDKLEYRWERGTLRYQGEEYQAAVEDFTKIVQVSTNTEELERAYHMLAILHEKVAMPQALLADLGWLINHKLADSNIYSWRSLYLERLGRYEEALADLTASLEIDSGTINYHPRRWRIYAQLGRYEDELNDLNAILQDRAFNDHYLSIVQLERANVFFKLGNKEQAFADYDESVRLSGDNSVKSAADYFASLPNED